MKNHSMTLFAVLVLVLTSSDLRGQWTQTSGPTGSTIIKLVVVNSDLFAAISRTSIYRSSDDGNTWIHSDSAALPGYLRDLFQLDSTLVAATDSGIFLSTTGGVTWSPVSGELPHSYYNRATSHGAFIFAGTYFNGVYRSSDTGKTWQTSNNGLPDKRVLSLTSTGPNLLIGVDGDSIGLYTSTDDGVHWQPRYPLSTRSDFLVPMEFYSFGNRVFAWIQHDAANFFYSHIIFSDDNGLTWHPPIFGGGGDFGPTFLCYDLAALGSTFFLAPQNVGRWSGIVVSPDTGKTWIPANIGLTDSLVTALVVKGDYLFAGTSKAGIWKRPISDIVAGVPSLTFDQPPDYRLLHNYPNPFNPSTQITFDIPVDAHVRVIVFNSLGQQVDCLADDFMHAGRHNIIWQPHVPTGAYFCRLEVSPPGTSGTSIARTMKMLFLK